MISMEPLARRHLEFLRSVRFHPEVSCWLFSPSVPISAEHQEKWFENFNDARIFVARVECREAGFGLQDTGYVGYGQVRNADFVHRSAEIGVVVAPEEQRKGYGGTIVYWLLDLVFKKLCLHRAWLELLSDNTRAMAFYKKCGFQVEGQLRDCILKDGHFRDALVMSRLGGQR